MPENSSPWVWIVVALAAGAVAGGLIVMYSMGKQAVTRAEYGSAIPGTVMSPQALPVPAIMTNQEDIVWTDWKGRERRITIHREVH